jgi:hypothetical protein
MVLLKSHSFISLFDIRIKSATDRNVVVVRGSPEDAASVLLSGHVVFAVSDPLSIKKITLKLTGTLRVNWIDTPVTIRGPISKPIRYETVLFDHEWNRLESGGGLSTGSSNSSLSSSSSSSHMLATGNHEMPFEMIIPGDAPESIEGHEGAQVVYKLVATVERGRFSNNLTAKKHIRIVRTVGPDMFDLSQTVSIDNTWPDKVEYNIEIPSKAVAIGSIMPIHFHMVPLLKGLKLGNIKVQVIEYTALATPAGFTHSSERVNSEHVIPAPENELTGLDVWDFDEVVQLPTSLSKCTQDCTIRTAIKVAHKVKFAISLINPDGHTSELRASLPIYLFISPNVPISSSDPAAVPGSRHPEEKMLFASSSYDAGRSIVGDISAAPPNYEDHIYDRLYNGLPTPSLSPEESVVSTPYRSRRSSFEQDGLAMTTLDASQRSLLAAGLRALELQQSSGFGGPTSQPVSGTTTPYHPAGDTSSSPDISHLSRVGTPSLTPQSEIDINALSRVPSYSTAMRNDAASEPEWAPDYEPSSGAASPSLMGASPLAPPTMAQLHNSRRAAASSIQPLQVLSAPGSSSQLSTLVQSHVASHSSSGSITRNSSTTDFLPRSSSSRSLLEQASRLVRLAKGNEPE